MGVVIWGVAKLGGVSGWGWGGPGGFGGVVKLGGAGKGCGHLGVAKLGVVIWVWSVGVWPMQALMGCAQSGRGQWVGCVGVWLEGAWPP